MATGTGTATDAVRVAVDRGPDRSVQFALQGYRFLPRLRASHGDPVAVRTRLLGETVLVVARPAGVRLFYDQERMTREGALPPLVRDTLFGAGAVQTLDGPRHLDRKSLIMSTVTPQAVGDLAAGARRLWDVAVDRWESQDRVVLFDEAVRVIGVAVLGWAGIPLTPGSAPRRVRDLLTIVDGFGTDPLAHVRARAAHHRAARWATELVEGVRRGDVATREGSPLHVMAEGRDGSGELLDARLAALDLLNIVRPTIAVSWHVTYSALALQAHPQWRARLRGLEEPSRTAEIEAFAHEVRRFHPFTPALAARARHDFTWHGEEVPRGRLVILDVHGTNHDPADWQHGDRFYPHRFGGTTPAGLPAGDHDPDAFVPNGGGDVWSTHRCAGEGVMTAIMAGAIETLLRVEYDLPEQDLSVGTRRIPPRAGDGFVMTRVRRAALEGPARRS